MHCALISTKLKVVKGNTSVVTADVGTSPEVPDGESGYTPMNTVTQENGTQTENDDIAAD